MASSDEAMIADLQDALKYNLPLNGLGPAREVLASIAAGTDGPQTKPARDDIVGAEGGFDITLGEGPLGLELSPSPASAGGVGAIILSTQGQAAAGASARLVPGCVLVGVNGRNVRIAVNESSTAQMNFRVTMAILQQAARPVKLRFLPPQKSSFDTAWFSTGSTGHIGGTYEVVFMDTAIGLELVERDAARSAEVQRLVGAASACGRIAIGDVLVSVNGSETSELSFRETMALVTKAGRPLRLQFHNAWHWSYDEFEPYFP